MPRKKRLQNGKLRPAVARGKARRSKAQRAAWLAQFEPGARDRFFRHADADQAVWLRSFEKATGLVRDEAADSLERIADARGWMKLRTLDRTVVGIAPPKANERQEVPSG